MSAQEPDLERGDGSLKVPGNPFAALSPSHKATTPAQNAQQQRVRSSSRKASAIPRTRSISRNRQSQHRPLSKAIQHDPNAIPPKLLKLRTVIGISTPEGLAINTPSSNNPFSKRPGPNLGIYARVIAEEKQARFQFYFAASVINTCYFGQIVVAAALTALGASSASHIVITVLGALNTVIAGILTYLKGQGLPNRLRQYWNGLRKCREFIEEKERECAAEGWMDEDEGMDIEHEIDVMVKMYHDVRQTAEDNTPDTYLPMQGNSAALLSRTHPAGEKPNIAGSVNGSVPYPEDEELSDSETDHGAVEGPNDTSKPTGTVPPTPAAPTTTPVGSPKHGPLPPATANEVVNPG